MAADSRSTGQRFWRWLGSVRTGLVLLIIVGLVSATGTLVLQRPLTEPEQLQRAYSPETLRWLDALGLTDVFHAWWFVGLLLLLCLNIVLASLERFPAAWRFLARPYRRPEPHFRAGLALQKQFAIRDEESGVEAAETVFRRMGLKPQRVGNSSGASLFAERNRLSRLAPYVVHASLLLIVGGGIADAVWGYRGYLALTLNQQANQIEMRDGARKTLPFVVRCEGAGREDYPDGSPRRWWSRLAVVEAGREVKKKEIEVNDPLVHRGIRFYQSGYGSTGEVAALHLRATLKADPRGIRDVWLRPGELLRLDEETSVRLAAFYPDFVLRGNRMESRSDQPNNPAIQLVVATKKSDETNVWLFPRFPGFAYKDSSPYGFEVRDLQMGYFTGLQVSHEPGQWAVWAGVILMGLGLVLAFYFVHVRYWAVTLDDGRGRLVLWVGASASKNREWLQERFSKLVEDVENELKTHSEAYAATRAGSLVST